MNKWNFRFKPWIFPAENRPSNIEGQGINRGGQAEDAGKGRGRDVNMISLEKERDRGQPLRKGEIPSSFGLEWKAQEDKETETVMRGLQGLRSPIHPSFPFCLFQKGWWNFSVGTYFVSSSFGFWFACLLFRFHTGVWIKGLHPGLAPHSFIFWAVFSLSYLDWVQTWNHPTFFHEFAFSQQCVQVGVKLVPSCGPREDLASSNLCKYKTVDSWCFVRGRLRCYYICRPLLLPKVTKI